MTTSEFAGSRFDFPFGDSSRQLMSFAVEEADKLNHGFIGTGHLLLGYLRVSPAALSSLSDRFKSLNYQKARNAFEFIIGRGDKPIIEGVGFTPLSKRTIELGIDEAKLLGDRSLEPDHIFLGIIKRNESIVAGVLETLGVDINEARMITIASRQVNPESKKLDSLDMLRAFLSDPNQNQSSREALQKTLDGLANFINPPN